MSEHLTADPLPAGAGRWPAWAWAVAVGAAALLALSAAVESGAFGYGSAQVAIGDTAYFGVAVIAASLALAGAWHQRDLAGWGLIGLAMAAYVAGDLYFRLEVDAVEGPYPSPADGLYFAFYGLAILGIRNLARRARREPIPLSTLLTPLLGLATLWSWIVFDPVLGNLEGTTAARMTTVAYPFCDLMLICTGVIALTMVGRRAGPSLLLLIGGAALIGVADALYAADVGQGSFADQTPINTLWPAGAILIAAAPWVGPARAPVGRRRSRLDLALALGAFGVALVILLSDHFERIDTVTVALAALTLAAAAVRLAQLFYEADRAREGMLEARREQGRIQALHTAAAEAALDSIVTVDAAGEVVDWNRAAQRTFGYTRQQALGRVVSSLVVPPRDREAYQRAFARFAAGEAPRIAGKRIEMTGLRSDLVEIPVEVVFTAAGDDPPRFTAYIRDISERKHQEAERDRLAEMVRSAEDAMISIDLDLQVIAWNPAAEQIYGYPADRIVGQSLRRLVPEDRHEELAGLVEAVCRGESVSLETKAVHETGEVIDIALRAYPIRSEIGEISGFSSVTRDITDRRERERRERLDRERDAWRHQLEEALDHDGFVFHRQPVLDLRGGRIAHHELLLRVRGHDGDLIAPGSFLPHAESSPALMRRIDRWAIRRGIGLAAEHPVAINLSAHSLADAGIAAAVQSGLAESGADARDVTFEITETAAAENLEAAHTLVEALRALGCGVALDDFGTGYGSFTYLLRMPVTSLKVDMEFIRALTEDPADQRVVRSIVAVAQNFGLTTVAEGVEEERTLRLIKGMGIDSVQGYLIGRPTGEWTSEDAVAGMAGPAPLR